jgi:hypothetical protein
LDWDSWDAHLQQPHPIFEKYVQLHDIGTKGMNLPI